MSQKYPDKITPSKKENLNDSPKKLQLSSSAVEEMARNGFEALPDLVRVILNSVRQAERSKYLQANAYELKPDARGCCHKILSIYALNKGP